MCTVYCEYPRHSSDVFCFDITRRCFQLQQHCFILVVVLCSFPLDLLLFSVFSFEIVVCIIPYDLNQIINNKNLHKFKKVFIVILCDFKIVDKIFRSNRVDFSFSFFLLHCANKVPVSKIAF